MSEWISVVGWRRFQHYDPSKRQPPWVKAYLDLMDNAEYLALSEHCALILHRLWLTYASARCQVRLNTSSLSRQLGLRVMRRDITSLCDAGFIAIVASKTLAEGYHDASLRARATETETEKETDTPPTPPQGGNGKYPGRISTKGYTGCRIVRGEMGIGAKYDPLGRDKPPSDWPHGQPSADEIRKALEERETAAF